jgi:hypothetical protein
MKIKLNELLSDQETALLKKLDITTFSTVKVKTGSKVIKGITTCLLCKTVTTQCIRMARYSTGSWEKEEEISIDKIGEDYTENLLENVRTCWACEAYLLSKDKAELVKLILRLYGGKLAKEELVKFLAEYRQAKKAERGVVNTKDSYE